MINKISHQILYQYPTIPCPIEPSPSFPSPILLILSNSSKFLIRIHRPRFIEPSPSLPSLILLILLNLYYLANLTDPPLMESGISA